MIGSVYLNTIVPLNTLSVIISVKRENFEQFNYTVDKHLCGIIMSVSNYTCISVIILCGKKIGLLNCKFLTIIVLCIR